MIKVSTGSSYRRSSFNVLKTIDSSLGTSSYSFSLVSNSKSTISTLLSPPHICRVNSDLLLSLCGSSETHHNYHRHFHRKVFQSRQVQIRLFASAKQANVKDENGEIKSPPPPLPEEKKSMSVKEMMSKYGIVFLVYWNTCWVVTLGLTYGVVSTEVLGSSADILNFLASKGFELNVDPRLGDGIVAIAVNEILEVIRFPIVIATTPTLANWWSRFRNKEMKK